MKPSGVADSPCSAGCRVCGGSDLDLLDVGVAIASDNVSLSASVDW